MGGLFTQILAKITGFAAWIGSLFVAVFAALWDVVKDAWSWVFDQILSVVTSAITAIDVSGWDSLSSYGGIPSDLMNILGLLGVGQAIAIITAAIAIRFTLQGWSCCRVCDVQK